MKTDELRTVQQIPVHHMGGAPQGPGHPQVQISIVKNVVVAQWLFRKKGDTGDMHMHPHDHMTLVARGEVLVDSDAGARRYGQDQIIVIEAGIAHQLTATADDTVIYCIQALRKSELEDDIVAPDESTDSVAPLTIGRAK